MKKYIILLSALAFTFSNCTKEDRSSGASPDYASSSNSSGNNGNSGIITAAEWNDLDNWQFWQDLQKENEVNEFNNHWKISLNNRVSIVVKNGSNLIPNALVELKKNGATTWAAKTDNFGSAELWIGFINKQSINELNGYQLHVNGSAVNANLGLYNSVPIEVQAKAGSLQNSIELAFIVDATGSMTDEINFLKEDLKDVLQRVKDNNPATRLSTATVFYRDQNEKYLVRKSNFTENINSTIGFIEDQKAAGGGDYPEAVHDGLNEAIRNLQWSENSKTKVAFLLLDAPPHHEASILNNIAVNTKLAALKGIKIIPISASGINKETEFLLRYLAIATNGTYVFITNDSGVGNDHIEATVGPYSVEYLNDLMVRLVNKYAK